MFPLSRFSHFAGVESGNLLGRVYGSTLPKEWHISTPSLGGGIHRSKISQHWG